jgi:hypothetical protein
MLKKLMVCLKCRDFKVYFLLVWTDEIEGQNPSSFIESSNQGSIEKLDASWKLSSSGLNLEVMVHPSWTLELYHL